MNSELKFLLTITKNLPQIRGFGIIGSLCQKFYNRKKRELELVEFSGIQMELDPFETVDGALLFYPQLYDWQEVAFIRNNLSQGAVFFDIGANIGYYSILASSIVKNEGQVVAIEADPYNIEKLQKNIKLNKCVNIQIVKKGVSNIKELLSINKNLSGNRGGNTFVGAVKQDEESAIELEPLIDIVKSLNIGHIDFLKIDIEGYEYRVLDKYFKTQDCIKPKNILIEINVAYQNEGSTSLGTLLANNGYIKIKQFRDNSIFQLATI
jgi:FkbM family methyltransferase